MACSSCKQKHNHTAVSDAEIKSEIGKLNKRSITILNVINIIVRLFIFSISLLFLPVVLILTVYMLFKAIVMQNNEMDFKPTLMRIFNMLKKKDVEIKGEEDNDEDTDNPDDYEIVGIDEINRNGDTK